VRLLLDTNVLIWALEDSPKLGAQARNEMGLAGEIFVSAASVWECEIKAGMGKLKLPAGYLSQIAAAGFSELEITYDHAKAISGVELPHKDPFDQMLLSQATHEDLLFVTVDEVLLKAYPAICLDGRK